VDKSRTQEREALKASKDFFIVLNTYIIIHMSHRVTFTTMIDSGAELLLMRCHVAQALKDIAYREEYSAYYSVIFDDQRDLVEFILRDSVGIDFVVESEKNSA